MLDINTIKGESMRCEYWEKQLKRFDPALCIRFDFNRECWFVCEYYPENGNPKFLFYLEDEQGKPKDFGQWAINKLNAQHLNWQHKDKVGVNTWFDELEKGAAAQRQEMDEKAREENLYAFRHDKLSMRKGVRELLGGVGSDVFAGYPKINYKEKVNVELKTASERTEVSRTDGTSLQSDSREGENSNQ